MSIFWVNILTTWQHYLPFSILQGEIEQRQRDKVKRGERTILQYFDWIEEDPKYLALDELNPPLEDERYRERGSWVYKKLEYDN